MNETFNRKIEIRVNDNHFRTGKYGVAIVETENGVMKSIAKPLVMEPLESGQVIMPIRVQRKRTKGWKMPPNTVYVGRGSEFGNPFKVGIDGTAEECIRKYIKEMMPYTHREPNNGLDKFLISEAFLRSVERLRGKNLACWCPVDCEDCNGIGGDYTGRLRLDGGPEYATCATCKGVPRHPCHADYLLKLANEPRDL